MCIIFQALQSHKRCSDYHLTLTVQRCPSLLWHRSTSLLVRHSPPMVVAHQFCPPLARPARWLPPARRLQRMDGKRATVRPSVRLLPTLGIFKMSCSIKKELQITITSEKDSQQKCCCLSVVLLAPTYLQPIASSEQFQFNDNFCFKPWHTKVGNE